MDNETIVAVYDTPAHAQLAVADLQLAGVAASDISQHAGDADVTGGTPVGQAGSAHESGFWSRLFGGESDTDTAVYSRSVQGGSTVVTVKAAGERIAAIMQVLESHHPIDIDERASSYGLANTSTATLPMAAAPGTNAGSAVEGNSLELAEERLTVGKRLVNRGGTRIRRYVVETPVEQQVNLREEHVTLDRRPVTDGRPAGIADFSEKVIEMTETAEEAVVGKTTHVTEEVALHKQASDRVETIRDTVRRQEVDVEDLPGAAPTAPPTTVTPKV